MTCIRWTAGASRRTSISHSARPNRDGISGEGILGWSVAGGSGQDHSGWAGIMEANEQVTFPPLPCDRYPAAGHPLPDLPPHRGVPARQPQRGPDPALPPGPSRSALRPFPVALRRLPALGTVAGVDCPGRPCVSRAGGRQRSQSVATLRERPYIEPPLSVSGSV
jgi:hypothetical protein